MWQEELARKYQQIYGDIGENFSVYSLAYDVLHYSQNLDHRQ